MKDRIGKVIFVLVLLFILYLFFAPYIVIELWNIQYGRTTMMERAFNDIKDDIDNTINKSKYEKKFDEYIKKRFGKSLSEKLKIIENDGHQYMVKLNNIMDETFSISYHKGIDAFSDNFYDVISYDTKFQHLYSNWVKKQVGIEDENVEFEFAGKYDTPYIEFDKIETLSKDYREIFENTHNLYAWLCEVSKISYLNENNKLKIANNIRETYLLKAINITNIPIDKKFGGRIRISSEDIDINNKKTYTFDFDINNLNDNLSKMYEKHY